MDPGSNNYLIAKIEIKKRSSLHKCMILKLHFGTNMVSVFSFPLSVSPVYSCPPGLVLQQIADPLKSTVGNKETSD